MCFYPIQRKRFVLQKSESKKSYYYIKLFTKIPQKRQEFCQHIKNELFQAICNKDNI